MQYLIKGALPSLPMVTDYHTKDGRFVVVNEGDYYILYDLKESTLTEFDYLAQIENTIKERYAKC